MRKQRKKKRLKKKLNLPSLKDKSKIKEGECLSSLWRAKKKKYQSRKGTTKVNSRKKTKL
jgi:hypothetical protein